MDAEHKTNALVKITVNGHMYQNVGFQTFEKREKQEQNLHLPKKVFIELLGTGPVRTISIAQMRTPNVHMKIRRRIFIRFK